MSRYIAAFTEAAASYPAYLSVNREGHNSNVLTARERGHNGNRMVSVHINDAELEAFAKAILTNLPKA